MLFKYSFFCLNNVYRRQSSNVWSYFESDSNDSTVAHCKLCQSRVKRAQGTSNLHSHMQKHHPTIWNRQAPTDMASNCLDSPSTSKSCDEPLPKSNLHQKRLRSLTFFLT